MSTTTESRQVTVTRPVTVYTCDGPACKQTIDVPTQQIGTPPGWIVTCNITAADPAAEDRVNHFCSRDCLADAVVP